MSTNADALVRDGINAYREGRKDEARNLLIQAVEIDEESEQGWLWLSAVVDTVEDQQTCLENVLTINPNNEKARQGLEILQERAGDSPAVTTPGSVSAATAPSSADDDPFAQVSFTPDLDAELAPSSDPFAAEVDDFDMDDDDELPDTQWDIIQTSSASAQKPAVAEPSHEEYDDWVSGLNLGSGESSEVFGDIPASAASAPSSSPFFDGDLLFEEEDSPFEVDDNAFDIGAQVAGLRSDEDEDEDEDGFSASPFMTDFDVDEEEEPPARPTPAASSPITTAPRPKSPVPTTSSDPLLDNLDDSEFDFEDDLFDEFDDRDFDSVDPSELFRFIPNEIKATRLPGTRERYPVLVIIGLLLLLVLNGGAIALVYMTLTTA